MSDTKISALPDGGAVQSTDEFVAARAGTNVKIAGSEIGGGGSLPASWTDDGHGSVIAETDGEDAAALSVRQSDPTHTVEPFQVMGIAGMTGIYFAVYDDPDNLVQIYSIDTDGGHSFVNFAGNATVLQISSPSGFTGNFLEFGQNYSPFARYLRVNNGGYLGIRTHSEPADADVATGEVMLWFDQTNGAAKLMLKGKSADGTVVSGEVPLT